MKVPLQLTGLAKGGLFLDEHGTGRWEGTNWQPIFDPIYTPQYGQYFFETYAGGFAKTNRYSPESPSDVFTNFQWPTLTETNPAQLARWSLRVRRFRVTAPGWTTAGYIYHHKNGSTDTGATSWAARSAPLFNKTYRAGSIQFTVGGFIDPVHDFWYYPDETALLNASGLGDFIHPNQNPNDPNYIYSGNSYSSFIPNFVDESPTLLTGSPSDAAPGAALAMGASFWFERKVVTVIGGMYFRLGVQGSLQTEDTDDVESPYYLGAYNNSGADGYLGPTFAPFTTVVDENTLNYKNIIGPSTTWPHGKGEQDPGPPSDPNDDDPFAHDWVELVSPPGGGIVQIAPGESDGTFYYKLDTKIEAIEFWSYSETYDPTTGAQLVDPFS